MLKTAQNKSIGDGQTENKLAPTTENKSISNQIEVTLKRDTYHGGVFYTKGAKIMIDKSDLKNLTGLVECDGEACEICK